jgi:adenylosuccinate lyase
MLTAISPIDGRYKDKTKELEAYFSEFALIKYRVWVEIQYLIALKAFNLPELAALDDKILHQLTELWSKFDVEDAADVKSIERETNHDVKAVEYYVKNKLRNLGGATYEEFVHFGLTSQDINNTAIPLTVKYAVQQVYLPLLLQVVSKLEYLSKQWLDIPMLARTHGQPASPTTVGKELMVFVARLKIQIDQLNNIPFSAKFGGATGNMNAHYVSYPEKDWHGFANDFVTTYLGLQRSYPTTQIEHYDNLAALFDACARINNILIDACRDLWTYISMDYFKQKVVHGEIGSSAMPHKVNPIDFENAEGNFAIANAFFSFLSQKLPVSRLQRDLTDSTVLRNIGVPFAHTIIGFKSFVKGLEKLQLNKKVLQEELDKNWAVVAEAIQTVLRKEGYPKPYEALKQLTRGNQNIDKSSIDDFIDKLVIDQRIKNQLKLITPFNYVGKV